MQLPPNLERVNTSVTHGGAAGTNQTDTIVSAPGAFWRLRCWGYTIVHGKANATPAIIGTFAGSGGVGFGDAGIAAGGGAFMAWIPGGYALGTNEAINLRNWQANAVAGTQLRVSVWYTTEAV